MNNITFNDLPRVLEEVTKQLAEIREALATQQASQTANNNSPFISREEASDLLKIGASTLDDWCKEGIITKYKIENTNKPYYNREEIIKLIESSEVKRA